MTPRYLKIVKMIVSIGSFCLDISLLTVSIHCKPNIFKLHVLHKQSVLMPICVWQSVIQRVLVRFAHPRYREQNIDNEVRAAPSSSIFW